MRIAPALLALGLLGCQSASVPPSPVQAAQPAPVVARQAQSEIPPAPPRRPLARLNPRRQNLEVGEAPALPARRPMKVGVRVIPQAPMAIQPRVYSPPPPLYVPPVARVVAQPAPNPPIEVSNQAQIEALVTRQREQIRRQNEFLMNRPQPGQGLTPQMQQIAYPQLPSVGPSLAHQQAERRYLEARADFLNTKYVPPGMPPRYTPESVRGMVGTGMPLPPQMMGQPAIFNPVLQKAQQAEVLRQEMVRTP